MMSGSRGPRITQGNKYTKSRKRQSQLSALARAHPHIFNDKVHQLMEEMNLCPNYPKT